MKRRFGDWLLAGSCLVAGCSSGTSLSRLSGGKKPETGGRTAPSALTDVPFGQPTVTQSDGFSLVTAYATGVEGHCANGPYAPYDPACATHVATDASGHLQWRYDVTLKSPGGAAVTFVPSLAGSIASVKTADGFELIAAGSHGSAFTFDLHPDNPGAPDTFSECYNPTEEGAAWDDQRAFDGTFLHKTLGGQNHGLSSSRVEEWNFGLQGAPASSGAGFGWFQSKVWYAYFWNQLMGHDPDDAGCDAQGVTDSVLSNFDVNKEVHLGQLVDDKGELLDGGWANYLTVDHIISIDPKEPLHSTLAATAVVYMNETGLGQNVFNNFSVITSANPPTCPQVPGAISCNPTDPVIAADSGAAHAIGTLAETPWFDNPPAEEGSSIGFLNQRVYTTADTWSASVMEQNWAAHQVGRAANGQAVRIHTRVYYAIGSLAEVRKALQALHDKKAAGAKIAFARTSPNGADAGKPPSGPVPPGLFWAGQGGYAADSAGRYCWVASMTQWLAMGGPSSGGAGVVDYPAVLSGMIPNGTCALPPGFFWLQGGGGYLAKTDGHYCAFYSWANWLAAGGPPGGGTAVPDYPSIPTSMVSDGACSGS